MGETSSVCLIQNSSDIERIQVLSLSPSEDLV